MVANEIYNTIKNRLDTYKGVEKQSDLEYNLMRRLLAVEINQLMVKLIAVK
jgi:hypothetical protein